MFQEFFSLKGTVSPELCAKQTLRHIKLTDAKWFQICLCRRSNGILLHFIKEVKIGGHTGGLVPTYCVPRTCISGAKMKLRGVLLMSVSLSRTYVCKDCICTSTGATPGI
jgi:hypothetical protein